MTKIVAFPLVALLLTLLYGALEVPINKGIAHFFGDGMINWIAIERLKYHEEREAIVALTQNEQPKTRLFALSAAAEMGDTSPIPRMILDPDYEVRMSCLALATQHRVQAAGPNVVERIMNYDPWGEGARRVHFENLALLDALKATASRRNAETLAKLSISGDPDHGPLLGPVRDALVGLGPIAEAENAYVTWLKKPKELAVGGHHLGAAMQAVAALRVDGAFELVMTEFRRAGDFNGAFAALGILGGKKAEKVLAAYAADPPEGHHQTGRETARRQAAKLALLQLKARAEGKPVPTSLEQATREETAVDLLENYTDPPPRPSEPPSPSPEAAPTPTPTPEPTPEPTPAPTPVPDEGEDLLAAYGVGP